MYKHILVPVALEHGAATDAALQAAELLKSDGATITALTVLEPVPAFVATELPTGQLEQTQADALEMLRQEIGGEGDVRCVVVSGHPGRTIVDFAVENGADCIVVASHKPGLADYFLGSTAARVVRHAPCAVHVVR